jgi:hypothetical protein
MLASTMVVETVVVDPSMLATMWVLADLRAEVLVVLLAAPLAIVVLTISCSVPVTVAATAALPSEGNRSASASHQPDDRHDRHDARPHGAGLPLSGRRSGQGAELDLVESRRISSDTLLAQPRCNRF